MQQKHVLSLLLTAAMAVSLLILPAQAADRRQEILEGMTTEEKISQMIMPTFRYYVDDQGETQPLEEINALAQASLEKHGFAGVVLFAQNAAETEKNVRLIDAMQRASASVEGRPQLLVALDQEGGQVARLGQGTQMPGNMAMGAVGDPSATAAEAGIIGQELQAIGYNFDFAPVVDVNNNPANPVIGVRSFSDDPQTAAEQGTAFTQALQETGTIASLKHFPGHGDTATDSHTGLPCITKTYEELRSFELVPFQACIDAGAEAVMTAHIQYPSIETETYVSRQTGEEITLPATLSRTILTDILRGDMGFEGVIITDALQMDAIEAHFDRLDVARLAIEAGVDILLSPVSTTTEEDVQALDQYISDVAGMVEDGTISEDKVDAAVLRILSLKEKRGLLEAYDGSDLEQRVETAVSFVGSPANHEIEWDIAKKAITLVKNDDNVLPLTREGQKVAVLTAYDNETLAMSYGIGRLRDEGKLAKDSDIAVSSIHGMTFEEVSPLLEGREHVVVVSEISSAAALDPTQDAGAYSALVDQIIEAVHAAGGTVTILSAQLPYDAARYPDADAILVAWSSKGMSEDPRNPANGAVKQYGPNMPAAIYLAFSPDESPKGTLPVNLPALDQAYQYTDEILLPRGFGMGYENAGTVSEVSFRDVEKDAWFYPAVQWAVNQEPAITKGTGGDTFSPDALCTRAQIVTFLWRWAGCPQDDYPESGFADVPADAYYADAVDWAASAGIIQGTSKSTFRPDGLCTRAQTVTILWRLWGLFADTSSDAENPFSDVPADAYYADAVLWSLKAGVTKGVSKTEFAPDRSCSRAEAMTFLYRLFDAS